MQKRTCLDLTRRHRAIHRITVGLNTTQTRLYVESKTCPTERRTVSVSTRTRYVTTAVCTITVEQKFYGETSLSTLDTTTRLGAHG